MRPAKLGAADSAPSPAAVAETFAGWLATRRISARTRVTYAQRVGQFLAGANVHRAGALGGGHVGDVERGRLGQSQPGSAQSRSPAPGPGPRLRGG